MEKILSIISKSIEKLGKNLIDNLKGLGRIIFFSMKFFYWIPKKPFRLKELITQFYEIGNESIFIIALAGAFTGMVMAYQTYFGFRIISVDSLVGPVVALSLAKELAPVLSGLIVAGRSGSAMAAHIGSMKVTEQLDALEVMGISSFQYLAVPRIIAGSLCLPMLSAIFLFVGNVGSYFVGTKALLIDGTIYFSKLGKWMYVEDIGQGLIKAFFFGFIISIIGTYFGFQVKNGAAGVGRATNQAVVWAMISVLILDYILTSILVQIMNG